MKREPHLVPRWLPVLTLIHFLALGELPRAFAQGGSLTPPGAPAPTMKSLDEIDAKLEKRTPISSAPFTISEPGSYYLTTNLTVDSGDAITTAANGVTLDLNGFTISSTEATPAGTAIRIGDNSQDITITNGHIRGGVTNTGGVYSGSGFARGIYSLGSHNVRISRISVSRCLYYGISLLLFGTEVNTVVESCTVETVGALGIGAAIVKQSSASDCGSSAINGFDVSDCFGGSVSSTGITALIAQNCHGTSSSGSGSGSGIVATTALNCLGTSGGSGRGVDVQNAQNCHGISYGNNIGLNAERSAQNCYGECKSSNYGLVAAVAMSCHGKSDTGVGLRFTKVGANCFGERVSPAGADYVIGSGLGGPVNLPAP